MTLLDIDTEALRSAVSIASHTNADIEEACRLLNQITVHNDWTCPERYQINEHTQDNKMQANTLMNNTQSFYDAIRQSSERFDEEEQLKIQQMQALDDVLSTILQIVPGMTEINGGASIVHFDNIQGSLEG